MPRLRFAALPFLLVAALPAQDKGGAPLAAAPTFVHDFGKPGEKGAFRVQFDARGAGVVWLQMMDHFVDVAARDRQTHGPDDYVLLLWSGADYSFRVGEAQGPSVFAQDLLTAVWQYEERPDAVRFWIDSGRGVVLEKTFRHRGAQRGLAVELRLRNQGAAAGTLELALGGPSLLNKSEASLFGNPCVAIASAVDGETRHVGPRAGGAQDLLDVTGHELSMAGTTNRFFGGFLFPLDAGAQKAVTTVRVLSGPAVADEEFGIKPDTVPRVLLDLKLPLPAAGAESATTFGVYLGPKSFGVFEESPEYARFLPILDVDLDAPCCSVTVPGGRLVAKLLVRLLGVFHGLVGSWGLAIMMLTILVRGCLAPVNFRMQKSMRAYGKRMAVLKPKLDEIKQRYADDQKAYQQAMLAFQREHKLMPPLAGCLPIFLTMPIYLGLFTALRTAYDLRQQSFLFMQDLSQPDALFDLPFWPHHFNIMPALWISMFVFFQLRTPLPTDPQQRQMQQMMRFMPILFGVMLFNYASGLMVYMVTSMLWTFGESALVKRILGPIDPGAAAMAPSPMM